MLRVADLPHSDKLKFLTDENQPVAHVTVVKEEVVATPEAVAAEAGAPAEPEVIKKGKQETEEEGAAAAPRRPRRPRRRKRNRLRAASYELRATWRETDRRAGQSWNRISVHAA